MILIRILVSLAITAALAGPALAQTTPKSGTSGPVMYKCVDDRGKIYYSDKPTPECGQIQEMNRQGRILKKQETAKLGAAPKTVADDEKRRKDSAEKQRRDRALMSTYTSEDEIDLARDRSLAIPLQAIKTAENRLAKANAQLFDLKTQANRLAGEQKAIPPQLLEEIDARQTDVSALEAELQKKKSYAESIRVKYEADKLRYRELKTASQ